MIFSYEKRLGDMIKKTMFIFYATICFIALVQSSRAAIISQNTWSLTYVDSEETVGENGVATNAFDGDPATIWHTEWYEGSPPPPHEIQINLGGFFEIDGFRYLPRQDGKANGWIGQYEFYVSADGVDWGSPVASGVFVNDATEKERLFPVVQAQFVRLRVLTEINGNPWISAAEITVLGDPSTGNLAPEGVIDIPAGDITINAGDFVSFSGTGTDPDGDYDLIFLWSFGSGSGVPDSIEEDPGSVQFDSTGVFTVTYTVTDFLGLSDPTPAILTITVLGGSESIPISQSTWSLTYVDSEETVGENGVATNAFDGDPATIWHTEWYEGSPPPPHEIQINLGGLYEIEGFRYLPRQDGKINGTIGQYEFYVSLDGVNWGNPLVSGTFAANTIEKEVLCPVTMGQFIRLRALTEVNGNPWISAAEINMLGQCSAPSVRMLQPVDLHLQTSINISVTSNVCLDENLHSGWGVRFLLDGGIFNGGSELEPFGPVFDVTFSNVSKSEHTIDAIIIDQTGAEVNGFGTYHQINNVGVGDSYVAFGDSITAGSNDDISSDDISIDGRNIGGGYEPILNNLLTSAKGCPHTVVNEGIGGEESIEGLARVQSVLDAHLDAQYFLILFGTNDSHGTLPVPSGLDGNGVLLKTGDQGYAGSFLDHMQQMVDKVKLAGKLPVLAKVPITLGPCSTCIPFVDPDTASRNLLIQKYNVVIEALASAIGSGIIPPDFYGYFRTHQDQLADNLHPDGVGYQSMASLWYDALTQ